MNPMIWTWVAVPIIAAFALALVLRKVVFGQSRRKQEQAPRLTTTGRKARATILRVDPTGVVVNHIKVQCWVTFRLEPLDGGPITQGRKQIMINHVQIPRPGDVWPAWIDPVDPAEFAVGMPQGADPAQVPLFREFGIPHPLDKREDTVDDLQRLVDMKQQGLLTDDEFAAAKQKLLGER